METTPTATSEGTGTRAGAAGDTGGEARCPACGAALVLRHGPVVTPHFAHRPRQACRRTTGERRDRPRPMQLRLFELAPPVRPVRGRPAAPLTVRWSQEELPLEPAHRWRATTAPRRTVRVQRSTPGSGSGRNPWWTRLLDRLAAGLGGARPR